MATQKQIDANRRNARKSTGPVTDEGKKASRRNALKHGLSGSGLVLPHEDKTAVENRMAEWHSSLKPFDPYEMFMLEVIAVESIRIDRCRVHDRVLRDDQVRRAEDFWDDDLIQNADELASKMAKHPSVVSRLRATTPGASIVLERWKALARVLDDGDWSEAQESLALDLLGTPEALREGAASPLFAGAFGDEREHRKQLVSKQIAKLEYQIAEVLPARDAEERELRKAGLPDLDDRALRTLHRYESRCFKRLMWASQQMQSKHRIIASSTERVPEPSFPRPVKDVYIPPPPPVPTRPEPPVYRRPLLQNILSEQDVKFLLNEADKKAEASKPKLKNVPSPKNKPSQRAAKKRASSER